MGSIFNSTFMLFLPSSTLLFYAIYITLQNGKELSTFTGRTVKNREVPKHQHLAFLPHLCFLTTIMKNGKLKYSHGPENNPEPGYPNHTE